MKYRCPKCQSEARKYHNDVYDMDVRYKCNSCEYETDNEFNVSVGWQESYNHPNNMIHATHEIVIKYICPNLNKEFEVKRTKYEIDKDIVWFEQYREFIHKHVPYGVPRLYVYCECGNPHLILVDNYKFTGLKEALSMTAEEWEKLYE